MELEVKWLYLTSPVCILCEGFFFLLDFFLSLNPVSLFIFRSNYIQGIKMLGAYFHEVSQLE